MIEIDSNTLKFSFPHVHAEAGCSIDFQRTLRIPDDNNDYPLPPGLGSFPLQHVDDFSERLPESWGVHGGVFLPMYQAEALWINFDGSYPCAVKVAAGKINAITGEGWNSGALEDPQNYVVVPEQPWLDGFKVTDDMVRQFVAMPLGSGYSAEEQLTGKGEHGGLQIIVYPLKREVYLQRLLHITHFGLMADGLCHSESVDMSMAPGGLLKQTIHKDPYSLEDWDQENGLRLFVHLANSSMYKEITGECVPQEPVTASDYTSAGLPWFEYYSDSAETVKGSDKLAGLDSVAAKSIKKGGGVLPDNASVSPQSIKKIGSSNSVRTGKF